jgi:hypothetical protein
MTDQEIEAAVAELRASLDEYLRSDDFEMRAARAWMQIENGGLRTTAEMAEALGLPEQFLTVALAKQGKQFIADHGGLN